MMGEMADELGPECIIAAGDIHHFMGVESNSDPLWLTNYEHLPGRCGVPERLSLAPLL